MNTITLEWGVFKHELQKARAEGYAEGATHGYAQGAQETWNEGYEAGNADAYDVGFDDGRMSAVGTAYDEGYEAAMDAVQGDEQPEPACWDDFMEDERYEAGC